MTAKAQPVTVNGFTGLKALSKKGTQKGFTLALVDGTKLIRFSCDDVDQKRFDAYNNVVSSFRKK